MAFQVVCISRALAAGGEEVGRLVSEALGFRYVDEEVIEEAARTADVDPAAVAASERRAPLLQRIVDRLAAAQELSGPYTLAGGMPAEMFYPPLSGPRALPEDLRQLIKEALIRMAEMGHAVIVAHAASHALAGRPGVLRVLVTASPATRASRLAEAQGLTAGAAAAEIASSDKARQHYFRDFYGVSEELPTHYDLVLNTDVLGSDEVSALIVAAARRL